METMDFDDNTYANVPRKSDGVTISENFQWWKRRSGVAAVCLGLLCVLLLAGIIGLVFYYGVIGNPISTEGDQPANSLTIRTKEKVQLQNSLKELTAERDQLKKSLNSTTTERDQLQRSLNTNTKERDQLQSSLSTMTTERDQLQRSLNTKTKERDQLQSSLSTMTTERDQLQRSLNTKTKERDQLQSSLSTMTTERNKLQKNLNTQTTEKNQLQQSLTTKTKERDQLQNSLKVITAERDQLKNSLNSRTKEKDQVQNILNTMTTERDQLKTRLRFYEKPCPEGWWKFDGSCYYLSSTKDTGGASQRACRAMDAEDVIINSREEQLFIHGLKKNVWIGMFKKDTEWKWVDSTTVTSTYWMPGEPSSQDGINCVEITQAASDPLKSWRVVSCGTNTFSVCEKKAS